MTGGENPMLDAALAYAARGWHVLPLHGARRTDHRCTCGRTCASPAKHPRTEHGLDDATTDPATITAWWAKWPAANIGVRTGKVSGLVVVDVDVTGNEDGEQTLAELIDEHGAWPDDTLTGLTGSGGWHHVFAHPAGDVIIANTARKKLGPGLDARGDGGYIVAPPSRHASGDRYEWIDPDAPLRPLPAWLQAKLEKPADPPARRASSHPDATPPAGGTTSYARKALDARVAEVATAPAGQRNNTLNEAAFRAGQLIAGGQLAEGEAVAALTDAAASCGLGAHETEQTIRSGISAGREHPQYPDLSKTGRVPAGQRSASTPTSGSSTSSEAPNTRSVPNEPPPPDDTAEGAGDGTPDDPDATHNQTDAGNALRFVRRHGRDVRYVPQWKAWLTWDGQRWARDTTEEVMVRAKDTATGIVTEAAAHPDHDERKKLFAWALKSEAEARLRSMIALAASEPGIPVEPHQLDADPWQLNVANGTIDLRTGELRAHDRADLITKLAPVDHDPDAHLDLWDDFLRTATAGDTDLARFLQRAIGYSLTGSTAEEVLFFVHGPAASGKSTFIDAIEATLGEYARRADFETFLARNDSAGGAARGDIARLAGARFVNSVEVDEGKKLAEGLVKTLTGGDTITARFLYRDEFEFRPAFKLWLAANHAPKVRHGDEGIWRRILRIPFEHVVPKADRDPAVKETLRDPQRGGRAILAWAIAGCTQWQASGLDVPHTVTAATDRYRADMDPLAEFLEDHCAFDPQQWVIAGDLRAAYEEWCKDQGLRHTMSMRNFKQLLEERGCIADKPRINGKSTRIWRGIRLLDPHERGQMFANDGAPVARDERDEQKATSEKSPREERSQEEFPEQPVYSSRSSRAVTEPFDRAGEAVPRDLPRVQCPQCNRWVTPTREALERGWDTVCAEFPNCSMEPF